MKEAKFVFEKAYEKETKGYLLKSFSNVMTKRELPDEYVASQPSFRLMNINPHKIIVNGWGSATTTIKIGEFITIDEYESLVTFLKAAGENLVKIKKLNAWKGEVEVTI